jgi:hypothetical protein
MLTCMADSQRLKEGRQHCLFDEVLWNQEIIADASCSFNTSTLWSSMDVPARPVLHAAIVFVAVSKLLVGKCVDYLPQIYHSLTP